MSALALLAFGPIYVVGGALVVGILLIAALGRRPGVERTEKPAENERRGAAKHPAIDEVESSVEKKAEFLIRMGFHELDWIADEPTPGTTAFRAKNPMPMAGGSYLIHFVARSRDAVDSARVDQFRKAVKAEEGVMKGILITSSAFTEESWTAAQSLPIELVDGKHLLGLLKMFQPDRFPPDRI